MGQKKEWATLTQSRPLSLIELTMYRVQVVEMTIGMFSDIFKKVWAAQKSRPARGKTTMETIAHLCYQINFITKNNEINSFQVLWEKYVTVVLVVQIFVKDILVD